MDCMYTLAYRCPRPTENVLHKRHELLFLRWVGLDAIHSIKVRVLRGGCFGGCSVFKVLVCKITIPYSSRWHFFGSRKRML